MPTVVVPVLFERVDPERFPQTWALTELWLAEEREAWLKTEISRNRDLARAMVRKYRELMLETTIVEEDFTETA